ncbi:hypothetical protein T06_2875 [Trichinella sp. T6]|nr:hypothetical protein T06_2875 [Trichinella sp. T6]
MRNHLECCDNLPNKTAGGIELVLYKKSVMKTPIIQLLSRNPAAGSIRQIRKRYAEKQRPVMMYTGEYTSGGRTIEPFLEALMYLMPEPI